LNEKCRQEEKQRHHLNLHHFIPSSLWYEFYVFKFITTQTEEQLLPPGRYAMVLQPPVMRETSSHEYALDVGFGVACRADFQLYYQGRISGTVVDNQGQGLSWIISAYPAGSDPRQSISSVADVVDGRFVLKQVPPGHYQLRFLPKINGRIQSGFIYYPGVRTEAEAVEVEVGDVPNGNSW